MRKILTLFLAAALVVTSSVFSSALTAQAAHKKLKLNVKKLSLSVGDVYQLRVYNLKKKQRVTFNSSNPEVAAFDGEQTFRKKVRVRAVSVGSATITATVRKGRKVRRTLKCRVTVSPNAVGIKFLKRWVQIPVDCRLRQDVIIKPSTSLEQPVFESDNPDVATVNCRGIVTAVSPGTVTITATLLSSNVSAHCKIRVVPKRSQEFPKEKVEVRSRK